MPQSHDRERNASQPSRSSRKKSRSGSVRSRDPEREEERRAGEVGGRVECERPARPDRGDEDASCGRAEDQRPVAGEAKQRVRLLEQPGAHRLRDDSLGRREEERGRRTAHHLECDQLPDLRSAGEDEHRDRRLRRPGERVGHDRDGGAEPVGPDADEDEDDLRQRAGGNDEPEIRRGATDVQHREGERDRRESAPEEGHRSPEEEQPEVPLGERAQAARSTGLRCQIRERYSYCSASRTLSLEARRAGKIAATIPTITAAIANTISCATGSVKSMKSTRHEQGPEDDAEDDPERAADHGRDHAS